MVNLDFTIVGLNDLTTEATKRINAVTTDGSQLYVGVDNLHGEGGIYRYNGNWQEISDGEFSGVGSLHFHQGSLFVGTLGGYGTYNSADVYKNNGGVWEDTNLSATLDYNASVRALTTLNNELYAAGSYGYIWKYNGTSWSNFYYGDVSSSHWTDLISDGTSALYGFATTVSYLNNSGVLKYNGTSWSAISTPGFGDLGNLLVRRFCFNNGILYAGTYNTSTGTEIWQYSGTTWTQLNTDGFGSRDNYSINDIYHDGDYLVVCTENPAGGEVWAYDGSWTEQTVGSTPKYQSFFYRKIQSTRYLVGKARKYVTTEAPTLVYDLSTLRSKGLPYWVDSNIGAIPIGGGEYRFFGANARNQAITEGTFDDPAATRISGYFSGAFSAGASSFSSTIVGSSIQYFKPDYYTRDIEYNGGGSIYKHEASGITLLFNHTEEYYNNTTAYYVTTIRQSVSLNDGLSFSDCGSVIADYFEVSTPVPPAGSTMSVATPIVSGDYLLLYYGGDLNSSSDNGRQLSVARASLSSVLNAAVSAETVTWQKYYNGSFSQNGLSGISSDLISTYLARPAASFYEALKSEEINKVFVIAPVFYDVIDQNLYALKVGETPAVSIQYSDDGINFSYPEKVTSHTFSGTYLGAVSPNSYKRVLDDTFALYTVIDPEVSGLKWVSGVEIRKSVATVLGLGTTESVGDGRYTAPFKINYAFDFSQLHPFIATVHNAGLQRDLMQASAYYYQNTSAFDSSSDWLNVVQSYANRNGTFPSSISDYLDFNFGREFHKYYYDYCHNFNRHRVVPSILALDGPTVLAHSHGSVIYNSKFDKQSNLNYITSSLANTKLIDASISAGTYSFSGELHNSGILAHVEFVFASGSSDNNHFSVIDIDNSRKSSVRRNPLLDENAIIRQKAYDSFNRLVFDIKKYSLDSTYYDVNTNFLSPNHDFNFQIKAMIGDEEGISLGGGTIGVWIHTKPEQNKIWSFFNDEWVQHDQTISLAQVVGYSNLFNFPQTNRDISNPNKFKCLKFLDTNNPNKANDVVASYDPDNFSTLSIDFHTNNKLTVVPGSYFDGVNPQVHRVAQEYVIEVFTIPTRDNKFTLFYDLNLTDLTLNKWSKPYVTKVNCKEFRIDLSKEQILTILKYFNQINGAYSPIGFASRVTSETQAYYEANGGSRINFVESPLWNTNTRNVVGLIEELTIIN